MLLIELEQSYTATIRVLDRINMMYKMEK